jgi:hypothetical protein
MKDRLLVIFFTCIIYTIGAIGWILLLAETAGMWWDTQFDKFIQAIIRPTE